MKVLAIDQVASEAETKPKVGKTAVLEVDPLQAQQLAIATKLGTLSMALRNIESQEAVQGRTVTNRDIGNSRLYIRERPAQRAAASPQYTPAAAQPGGQTVRPVPAVPTGPSMTIYRGIEGQAYPVGLLGVKK